MIKTRFTALHFASTPPPYLTRNGAAAHGRRQYALNRPGRRNSARLFGNFELLGIVLARVAAENALNGEWMKPAQWQARFGRNGGKVLDVGCGRNKVPGAV